MARGQEVTGEEFADVAIPLMGQVYTSALYLTRNRDEAEDLLQETYLRAYRFWSRFTPGTNCKAWLLTILHNVFRNRYRERQREQRTFAFDETVFEADRGGEIGDTTSNPEELLLSVLLDGEVEAALGQLPRDFLDAVVLVDVQELTYEEAAEAIGCPVGTVRSRLSRGRRLLYGFLHEYAASRGLIEGRR